MLKFTLFSILVFSAFLYTQEYQEKKYSETIYKPFFIDSYECKVHLSEDYKEYIEFYGHFFEIKKLSHTEFCPCMRGCRD